MPVFASPVTPILTGTTASGKTGLSLRLAKEFHACTGQTLELINADSLLFYRHLDIGTAKPSREEQATTPHHGIDLCDPGQSFTAADFRAFTLKTLDEIAARGNRALLIGGTGFYLKALLFGLWDAPPTSPEFRATLEARSTESLYAELAPQDPHTAQKIGPSDRYRLTRALEILALSGKKPSELEHAARAKPLDSAFELHWIDRSPEDLQSRILERTKSMLQTGLLEETARALKDWPQSAELKSVGYRQVVAYLRGETPAGRKVRPGILGLEDEIALGTRQLAKSQRTFFAGLEKEIQARTPEGTLPRVHNYLLPQDGEPLVQAILGTLTSGLEGERRR